MQFLMLALNHITLIRISFVLVMIILIEKETKVIFFAQETEREKAYTVRRETVY
jgi:hypothetical protein